MMILLHTTEYIHTVKNHHDHITYIINRNKNSRNVEVYYVSVVLYFNMGSI